MDTTELQNQAIEIRDAENEGENTATKVGTLLVNIIQVLAGAVTEESLTETLKAVEEVLQRDYASLENGTVKWHQRGVIMLKSMGSALDNIDGGSYTPTLEIGDTWFSQTSGGLKHRTQDGDEAWSVRPDAVYINSHTLRVYKWASGSMVELGSERNPIMIDYMVSKTLDSIAVGEVFWQSSNSKLVVKTGESSVRMFSPDPSVIYCARDTKSLMFWDTTTSTWQSVGGGNAGQITNINDGQNYRIWVGTQEDLDALNGVFEDDVIYFVGTVPQAVTRYSVNTNGLTHCTVPAGTPTKVTENGSFTVVVSPESGYTIDSCQATMGSSTINGVPLTGANAGKYQITIDAVTANIVITASASVHLQSITVTQDTRAGNTIQMNAVLNPANADNVSLQWSVSGGSQYVDINQSTGLLTILEGASNVSVTVTCTDANSNVSGTLPLTGLTYNDVISSLTAVGATRTGTNTLTLNADGRTSGVNFSLQGTVPTVKEVRRTTTSEEVEGETVETTTHELVDVPAVTLNGNVLTYKGDCTVRIKATAANDSSITCTNDIIITHDNADQIWFEDVETLKAVIGKSIGSASGNVLARVDEPSYTGCVTYAQAAAVSGKGSLILSSETLVTFNEFKWFTSITKAAASGASAVCHFKGCPNLEHIEVPSSLTSFSVLNAPAATASPIYGCSIEEIELPETVTTVGNYAFASMTKLRKVSVNTDTENGTIGAYIFSGTNTLTDVVFGENVKSIGSNVFSSIPNNQVELTLKSKTFVACAGFVSSQDRKLAKLHVPAGLLGTYKADTTWLGRVNGGKDNIYATADVNQEPQEGGQS